MRSLRSTLPVMLCKACQLPVAVLDTRKAAECDLCRETAATRDLAQLQRELERVTWLSDFPTNRG